MFNWFLLYKLIKNFSCAATMQKMWLTVANLFPSKQALTPEVLKFGLAAVKICNIITCVKM